jgi:hypothetical protein
MTVYPNKEKCGRPLARNFSVLMKHNRRSREEILLHLTEIIKTLAGF